VDTVIAEARAGSARLLLLEVRASNAPALALYRSAGFFEHGVRRAYYSDNGEDAVEMRLTLTPEPPNPVVEP
jgi:ribosomal-protein-alanine N-acetyltransferase